MAKFYIKSVLFVLIFILVLKVLDKLVIQDELFHVTHERFFESDENFDFVVMGNSLSQRSFNMPYIDSVLNTSSINIGSSAQHFYTTNVIFNDFIGNPELYPKKLLIVTISPWQFETLKDDTWKFLQMAPLDEVKMSKNYVETVNDFFEVNEYPKVFSSTIRLHGKYADNIIETHERLTLLRKINANGFVLNIKAKLDQNHRDLKKDLFEVANGYADSLKSAEEIVISEKADRIINDIVDKCLENKVQVLFVTPPAINMIYDKENYGIIKHFEKIFDSKKIKYLNLNRNFIELGLGYDDFNDFSHLNYYGNKKVAPFLLEYFTSQFGLTKSLKTSPEPEKSSQPSKIEEDENVLSTYNIVKTISDVQNHNNQLKHFEKDTYLLSRTSVIEPAFSTTAKIPSKKGQTYRLSIMVKKGEKDNVFGLRIQGIYPDRVDAVFDLDKGDVLGIKKSKDFTNESASIEPLENGWYKCSITAQVNSDFVKILFGPTSAEKDIVGWEGKTSQKTEVYIIPSSLTLEEVIQ